MLVKMEDMKYFLKTAYGDLEKFRESKSEVKSQETYQGNEAASAGWGVISIMICGLHKRKGHEAKCGCPISRTEGNLVATLFVTNMDVISLTT